MLEVLKDCLERLGVALLYVLTQFPVTWSVCFRPGVDSEQPLCFINLGTQPGGMDS